MELEKPKISIITVVYNDKEGIEKTIKSVIKQKFKQYEFIVINGLSSDGTSDVVDSYAQNINTYLNEKDDGISDAFNKGIKYATGDWIYFLNSGDYLLDENTLSAFYHNFLLNSSFDIVTGRVRIVDSKGEFLGYYHPNKTVKLENLKDKNIIAHQATFVKSEVFKKIGLFNDYKLQMDYDFWIRAWTKNVTFFFTNEVIANFTRTGVSSTRNNYKSALKEHFDILLINNLIYSYNKYQLLYNIYLYNIKTIIRGIVGQRISNYINSLRSKRL